ncbi:2774_t:CDS:2, partial [Dentiscutata erythropus]
AFVAFAAAEAEKLVETKGLDAIDKAKAKRHAEEQASQLYEEKYGGEC